MWGKHRCFLAAMLSLCRLMAAIDACSEEWVACTNLASSCSGPVIVRSLTLDAHLSPPAADEGTAVMDHWLDSQCSGRSQTPITRYIADPQTHEPIQHQQQPVLLVRARRLSDTGRHRNHALTSLTGKAQRLLPETRSSAHDRGHVPARDSRRVHHGLWHGIRAVSATSALLRWQCRT